MAVGSKLVLDTLVAAQGLLSTHKQNLENLESETDPTVQLSGLEDAKTDYEAYLTSLKRAFILNAIDPNGTYPDLKTQLDGLDGDAIGAGYEILAASTCNTGDAETEFTLDCLTELEFLDDENEPLVIAPIINRALKERIIAEAAVIVEFPYTGRYSNGTAFPVKVNNVDTAWDNLTVTARIVFEGVPFLYQRVGAASYSIQRSVSNFQGNDFTYGTGTFDVSNCTYSLDVGTPPNGVGSSFRYSTLNHLSATGSCQQSTGSAYFISECLFFGGQLPMRADEEVSFDCGNVQQLQNVESWLACCSVGTNLEATLAWRQHQQIMAHFQQVYDSPDMDEVLFGDPPTGSNAGTGLNKYMRFNLDQNNQGGIWRSQQLQAEGEAYLYDLFRVGGLASLESGDYLFLDLGNNTSAHGLLIVGWGAAVECANGLNAKPNIDFQLVRPRDSETNEPLDSIPFVADFAYGFNATLGKIGWLQDSRPRPFYATLTLLGEAQLQEQLGRLQNNGYVLTEENFSSKYYLRLRNGYDRFSSTLTELPPENWEFFRFPNFVHIPYPKLIGIVFPCP